MWPRVRVQLRALSRFVIQRPIKVFIRFISVCGSPCPLEGIL